MQAGPPLEDPKGGKLHEPLEGEDATPETTDPRTDSLLPH